MKPLDHDDGLGGASEQTTFLRGAHHRDHLDAGSAAVPNAALLFTGHYHQAGYDLVISRPFETVTIHDYFRADIKANLVAPDGSELSAAVVLALTEGRSGVQYAGDQPAPATAIGRVESASGDATVIRNGQTITLHAGDLVFKNDAVETGEQGSLAITFIDGTAFTLAESARMVLNDMVYQPGGSNNSSLLSLVQGSITFVAGDVAHTGEMKVDTPVATMGIRGTAVHVKISAHNGPTRFSVMREPNGRVGSYILYDHKSGAVLATVSEVGNVVELQLNNGQIIVNTIAKTPLDFQQEQDLTHQVFAAFQAGQQDSLLKALMQTPNQQGGSGSHGSSGPPQTGPAAGQQNDQTPDTHQPLTPPPAPPPSPAPTPPAQQNDDTPPPVAPDPVKATVVPPTAPAETVIIAKNAGFDGTLPIPSETITGVEAANAKSVTPVGSTATTITGLYGDLTISADGSFHYVANHARALYAQDTGIDVFTYTVTNASGLTTTGPLTFDVIGANEAPIIAAPSSQTIGVNNATAISGIVVSETGNVDGETFTATLSTLHGNLSVTGNGGTVTGSGSGNLTISGSLDQVNAYLATLQDSDATPGSDTISLNVTDSYGNSATQETITVTANGIPVITVPGPETIGAGQTSAIHGISLSESGNTSGETFSATISDTNGLLSVTGEGGGVVSGLGTTSLTITGVTLSELDAYRGSLTDTDATPGTDTIIINAQDSFGNSATPQTISVTVNSAPAITVPGMQTIGINQAVAISGISVAESGNTDGEIFTVTVSDLLGSLSVGSSINEPAVPISGTEPTDSSDPGEGGVFALADADLPIRSGFSSLTVVGTLDEINSQLALLTDTESRAGTDTITLSASDSFGNSATQQTIAVTVNGAPVISTPGTATLGVNQAHTISNVSLSESGNTDNETFSATLTDLHGNLFVSGSGGTVTGSGTTSLTILGPLGILNLYLQTLTDTDSTSGTDIITLNVTDSFGVSTTQEISVTANGLPVIAAPSSTTLGINQAHTISNVSLSESGNTDNEIFSATLTDLHGNLFVSGSGGTVTGSGSANLTISGSLDQVNAYLATLQDSDATAGSDTITLNASDGFGNGATQETIAVTANSAPVITVPGTQTLGAGVAGAISGINVVESGTTDGETFSATLTDTHGDLSVTGTGGVVSGSGTTSLSISGVTLAQLNAYLGTLSDTDATSGADTITLNASDSFGNSATQQTISVTANQAGWTGDTLGEIYYYPTAQSVYQGQQTFVVPANGLSGSDGVFSIAVGSSTIIASNFTFNSYWNDTATAGIPVSFNGFEVFDTSNNPEISGVTIDPSSNMAGLTDSNISFTSNSVSVNWEGLSFTTSTVVELDLTFDPPLDPSQVSVAQTLDGSLSPVSNTAALLVADGTELALSGTIDNSGTITLDGANAPTAVGIEGNVTLEGRGQFALSESNENYIIGTGALTNLDNEISGGGDIGNGTLTIHNAGVIEAEGPYALILDTGANPIVNTGILETNHGTLIVDSPVTGGGHSIINGGTIEFSGASDSDVSFSSGASGTLALDQSHAFTGTVSGFSTQDQIDLGDIAYSADSSFSYVQNDSAKSGTLSVSDGTHAASIALLGVFLASSFATASDGHGGTLITETVANNAPAAANNVGGSDAPFVFAPLTGPAVLVGSQSASISQTITGSPYADTITAGAGNDTLTGMGGGDTFVFKTNMGNDQITDLHTSNANGPQDVIDISAFHFADYQALLAATTTDASGDAAIALGSHTLTLDHVQKADLQSSLFHL